MKARAKKKSWTYIFFITRNQKTVTNRWSDQKLSSDWLIQPNTDNLQQAEDYVRDCTWQLERIKFIYRFQQSSHISYERKWFLSLLSLTRRDNEIKWFLSLLSLTRRDNEIKWFLSLLSLTRRDNEIKWFLSLLSLTRRDNERQGMQVVSMVA